jgi:hypothetical protein
MHKIIYLHLINNPAHPTSPFLTGAQDSHLQRVTIPEAAYIQLPRRPLEDEQGDARNIQRILINVLYVNNKNFVIKLEIK